MHIANTRNKWGVATSALFVAIFAVASITFLLRSTADSDIKTFNYNSPGITHQTGAAYKDGILNVWRNQNPPPGFPQRIWAGPNEDIDARNAGKMLVACFYIRDINRYHNNEASRVRLMITSDNGSNVLESEVLDLPEQFAGTTTSSGKGSEGESSGKDGEGGSSGKDGEGALSGKAAQSDYRRRCLNVELDKGQIYRDLEYHVRVQSGYVLVQKVVRTATNVPVQDDQGSVSPPSQTTGAKLPINYNLGSLSGTIRYAAPNGSESSNGTSVNSPTTLSRAISLSGANNTVVLRGGTYRNQRNITMYGSGKSGLKIIAYPGEIPVVSGAVQVSSTNGWSNEGGLRFRSYRPRPVTVGSGIDFVNTNANLTASTGYVGKYPDQVWIGNTQLRQVANKSQVTTGTFWVDHANNRLYMTGTDVSKGNIETSRPSPAGSTSDRDRLFLIQAPNITIEGIRITRFSNSANDYGVITIDANGSAVGNNLLLRNVEVSESAYMGIAFGRSDNSAVKNVTLTTSNWMGFSANQTDNLILDAVKVTKMNPFKEFSSSPASGALKTSRTRNTRVINSEIRDNTTHGLWFDESNINAVVANNTIVNNGASSLFYEISDGLLLANNYIRAPGNVARAVRLAGSSGLRLVNNTFVGGLHPFGIYTDSRSVPGCSSDQNACPSGSGAIPSNRNSRFPRPQTMDWMPRLDLAINNIVAYSGANASTPSGQLWCNQRYALFCINLRHGGSGAETTIEKVIHAANDPWPGIPQTVMRSNVFGKNEACINDASTQPVVQGGSALYRTISSFRNAMVNLTGSDSGSRCGTNWVQPNGAPTQNLSSRHNEAYPVPSDPELNKYIPAGTRHYGVTFGIE